MYKITYSKKHVVIVDNMRFTWRMRSQYDLGLHHGTFCNIIDVVKVEKCGMNNESRRGLVVGVVVVVKWLV